MKELAIPLSTKAQYGTYNFHLAKWVRQLYEVDEYLFKLNGNVILANLFQSRLLIKQMHDKKDIIAIDEEKVTAGNLFALGLIDEILHVVVGKYKEDVNQDIMTDLIQFITTYFKSESIDKVFSKFVEYYPPLEVYQNKITELDYLIGETNDTPNLNILIEEIIMLWINNQNPAFDSFEFLFEDKKIEQESNLRRPSF